MRGRFRRQFAYTARNRDERIADFEHAFETDGSVRRDCFAQRVLGQNDLYPRRLAVVPFRRVVGPVWADHTVPRRDLVPKQSAWRAGCADPGNVDGEPIGVKRVELVDKAADAECRRPVGRENSGGNQRVERTSPHPKRALEESVCGP